MLVKENLFDKSKVEIGRYINENNGIANLLEENKQYHRLGKLNQIKSF